MPVRTILNAPSGTQLFTEHIVPEGYPHNAVVDVTAYTKGYSSKYVPVPSIVQLAVETDISNAAYSITAKRAIQLGKALMKAGEAALAHDRGVRMAAMNSNRKIKR